MKNSLILFSSVAAVLFATSCSNIDYAGAERFYYRGQYQEAALRTQCESADSASVLPNLYNGSCHWMARNFPRCLAAFQRAECGLNEQDENWNLTPYYLGRTYDGVMMDAYIALSFMAMGDNEKARVAFNRLDDRQGKAALRNRKAIDRQQAKTAQARTQNNSQDTAVTLNNALSNEQNRHQLDAYRRHLANWGAYADYENPAACFFSGVYRLICMEDASDAEKAVFQLRKTYGMTQSPAVQKLLDLSEDIANGKISTDYRKNLVVVVFEDGLGPCKDEWKINLIIPCRHGILHAGLALPQLKKRSSAYPFIQLKSGEAMLGKTAIFCDFDSVVAAEFQRELPGLIAAEITECIIKVVAQAAAVEYARKEGDSLVALGTSILGSALSAVTTDADTRNWNLLPKQFQMAVIQRPASGKLQLAAPDGNTILAEITLPAEGPSMVYVKIPAIGLSPMCFIAHK